MILPIFSGRRIQMLEAFSRAAADGNFETISKTWSEFWNNLRDARGIFSVADPKYDNLALPHDTDFGTRGYLRGLLDGKRLAMIQNAGSTRRFLYNKTIFCDTNFVSYCDARCRGKSLGNNEQSFNQAVLALLPMRDSVNAFCYMMENFENLRQDRVRGTLKSFAAFKLGNEDVFRRTGVIQSRAPESELERIADVCLNVMATQDFKILHGRMKEHYFGSLLVLTKALLIVLTTPKEWNSSKRFMHLLEFFHSQVGRMLQFELHVAWRFFERGTEEPFFHKLTANVKQPFDVLRSMAWDLAHLRSSLDMLTMKSADPTSAGFPIPYFLSFDQRFVRLLEVFQFRGLIYYGDGSRYEVIYGFDFLNSLSEAMREAGEKYLTSEAIADRAKRCLEGDAFDSHLVELAKKTSDELQAHLTFTESTIVPLAL